MPARLRTRARLPLPPAGEVAGTLAGAAGVGAAATAGLAVSIAGGAAYGLARGTTPSSTGGCSPRVLCGPRGQRHARPDGAPQAGQRQVRRLPYWRRRSARQHAAGGAGAGPPLAAGSALHPSRPQRRSSTTATGPGGSRRRTFCAAAVARTRPAPGQARAKACARPVAPGPRQAQGPEPDLEHAACQVQGGDDFHFLLRYIATTGSPVCRALREELARTATAPKAGRRKRV